MIHPNSSDLENDNSQPVSINVSKNNNKIKRERKTGKVREMT